MIDMVLPGTWQQIVLVCFNNEPRDRKVLVSIQDFHASLSQLRGMVVSHL